MRFLTILATALFFLVLPYACAQESTRQMPVKELAVFKDGHAFVIHEGEMPTSEQGHVVLDYLPKPILGTFWAYSASPQVKLQAVVASYRRVALKRTALNLQELIEANMGARVVITEVSGAKLTGTIVSVPTRTPEELERTSPPNTGDLLPQKGTIFLLKTDEGTRAMPLNRVLDITFLGDHSTATTESEFRNQLILHLNWGNHPPQKTAKVGMMYVQKGVSWVPQYRLVLDGKGNARLYLQASLVNLLTDFHNATVNLVIGVPSFAYKDTPDPIALQQTFAQVARQSPDGIGGFGGLGQALSGQMVQLPESAKIATADVDNSLIVVGAEPSPSRDAGPEVSRAGASEDLFVFTVKGVSLRKGERMSLPVAEYTLKYRDIYTLFIPIGAGTPKSEVFTSEPQSLTTTPKLAHKVRLENTTEHPFTTAPILLFSGDTPMAQETITYTPRKGGVDIPISTAVNIPVKRTDREVKRTERALTRSGVDYTLIEMEGTVTLTNYTDKAVDLEVTRLVQGEVQSTSPEAEVSKRSTVIQVMPGGGRQVFQSDGLNPLSQIVWKLSLAPGKSVDLNCTWRYYAR